MNEKTSDDRFFFSLSQGEDGILPIDSFCTQKYVQYEGNFKMLKI